MGEEVGRRQAGGVRGRAARAKLSECKQGYDQKSYLPHPFTASKHSVRSSVGNRVSLMDPKGRCRQLYHSHMSFHKSPNGTRHGILASTCLAEYERKDS
jgi:hypothetical protein